MGRRSAFPSARGLAVGPGGDDLEEATGEHGLLGQLATRPGPRVAPVLEEEPLLLSALRPPRADERPLSAELVAGELEDELPLLQTLEGIADRRPRAAVPHHNSARAEVARRDRALAV